MMRIQQSRRLPVLMTLSVVWMGAVSAFVPSGMTRSQPVFQNDAFLPPHHQQKLPSNRQSTELNFMGSDGGILGVGPPELVCRRFVLFLLLLVFGELRVELTFMFTFFHSLPPFRFILFYWLMYFVFALSIYIQLIVYNFVGGLFCFGTF
jgi:hypothetical protein